MSFGKTILGVMLLTALIIVTGCHKTQDADAASNAPGTDNLAPISNYPESGQTTSAPQQNNGQQQNYTQQQNNAQPQQYSTAPQQSNNSYGPAQPVDNYQDNGQSNNDSAYGEQPEYYASQPPPEMPQYDQPPCPGDDYLWTPGYWAYSQEGYYWVPGAWVEAPYQGALWTPGYWGYTNGRYGYYNGYWGPYIGYYGGINYGFGYVGLGYQGGYWNRGHFYYNRSVNNVNITVEHNVYNRNVTYSEGNRGRVSYNGGNGGVQARPRPAELAAARAPHTAPMSTQVQYQHAAQENRGQFASVNHGRPAVQAATQPIHADRNVRAITPAQVVPHAAPATEQRLGQQQARPEQQQQQKAVPEQQQHAMPEQQQHSTPHQEHAAPQQQRVTPQQEQRPAEQSRPAQQSRPAPGQPHAVTQPQRTEAQPQRQAQPTQHAAPQQQHPAEQPQRQAQPAEHPQASAPRAAAPRAAAPARPAATQEARPEEKK